MPFAMAPPSARGETPEDKRPYPIDCGAESKLSRGG